MCYILRYNRVYLKEVCTSKCLYIEVIKTKKAFEIYLKDSDFLKKTFVVAGGVAANKGIKKKAALSSCPRIFTT